MGPVQEREPAEAVAAAGLGAMYYVIGHNRSDLWGATREAFALRGAAADIGDGPATDLLRDAAAEVVERQTGAARGVNLRDKDALRAVGLEQVSGVLPVLGQLPPGGAADQVRQWILRDRRRRLPRRRTTSARPTRSVAPSSGPSRRSEPC